jgi:hypothetical protein
MKLMLHGELCDASCVEIVNSEEKSCRYLLANGAIVRVRTILLGVYEIHGKKDHLGRPVYHVESHLIATVDEGEVVVEEQRG